MSHAQIETYKTRAVNSVLFTLGEPLFNVLKDHLQREFDIQLHDNSFTLEDLQVALETMLGESSTDLLIKEIHWQIRELANAQLR
ncbi:MAG TPA: hypothetical protein VH621_02880 [Nitrososphaera sp.]|jgi:hypothetical protein